MDLTSPPYLYCGPPRFLCTLIALVLFKEIDQLMANALDILKCPQTIFTFVIAVQFKVCISCVIQDFYFLCKPKFQFPVQFKISISCVIQNLYFLCNPIFVFPSESKTCISCIIQDLYCIC